MDSWEFEEIRCFLKCEPRIFQFSRNYEGTRMDDENQNRKSLNFVVDLRDTAMVQPSGVDLAIACFFYFGVERCHEVCEVAHASD